MRPRYASLADEITTWVICIMALLSNTLTIYTMVKTKQGIGQKARLYVIGLSISDAFIVPTLAIELTLSRIGYLYQPVFNLDSDIQPGIFQKERVSNILLGFMYFLGMGSSLYILLAVAVDRLIAIAKPLVYRTFITDKRIKGIMIMIWIYMAFIGSWIFVYCGLRVQPDEMLRTFMPMDVLPRRISDYVLMPHMYFAVLGNAVMYILVYYQLKKLSKEKKKEESRSLQRNRRFFRMVVATIVVQLTLWAPYTLMHNFVDINQEDSPQYMTDYVQPFVYAVTLCNNWINPLLYCALNKDYRMAYLKVFGRRRKVTNVAPASTSVKDSATNE